MSETIRVHFLSMDTSTHKREKKQFKKTNKELFGLYLSNLRHLVQLHLGHAHFNFVV